MQPLTEIKTTVKLVSFIIKHKIKQCKCFLGLHTWSDWDYIDHPGAIEERQCKCGKKQTQPHKEVVKLS